ncbi:hypothetical protein SLA2020_443170 [Shorea laevis]
MTITVLKRIVSRRVEYTYKHIYISIPRQCGTSQSPPLGTQRSRWRPSWACARSPHLRLGYGSDTICNDPSHPKDTILSAFGSPNQTSQEVTHPGTTLI